MSDTADAVNHAVDKIGDAIAQVTQMVSSHGPQAWELIVQGAYARAVATIITSAIMIPCAIVTGIGTAICVRAFIREGKKDWHESSDVIGVVSVVGGIVCTAASAACIVGALVGLMDSHSWAMIFAPQGTVARDLLMKAL